jgi:hypothetical protein
MGADSIHDYIVIGSGCSGAIAAQTLVEAGVNVAMLDVGVKKDSTTKIPDKDFIALRKTDTGQHQYFIGKHAEGVNWGKVGTGAQITPPRKYILRLVDRYTPLQSSTFLNFESLGYGGMGIGWGLQAWEYSHDDLKAAGLDAAKMARAYDHLAKKIGVSASSNDVTKPVTQDFGNYQPAPKMDRNNSYMYKKYLAHRKSFNKKGITLGQTPLALLTKSIGERQKYAYSGMDFYADQGKSAWRPWITVDQLKKKANFTYLDGYLVLRFAEKKDIVEVHCLQVDTDKSVVFKCRKLILGAGALGSARIVLRSFKEEGVKLPFLSNPYTYVPCVQPRMVGKEVEARKLSFAQLSIFLDKDSSGEQASMASFHSYQSLLLFRIINQVPFNLVDARIIMRYLSSGIIIMGVYHPDGQSNNKYVQLIPDSKSPTGDKLKVEYAISTAEAKEFKARENKLMKAVRKMGTYPITRINPGHGTAIHYGGTLPFSNSNEEKPYTLSPSGRLHMTKNVYVADSSGFTYLPAQGLTFSIMANAHLVAEGVLDGSN